MSITPERVEQIIAHAKELTPAFYGKPLSAAAEDFMRNHHARQARTPQQAKADRDDRWIAILGQMGQGK